jgi:hypothetical protein
MGFSRKALSDRALSEIEFDIIITIYQERAFVKIDEPVPRVH